MLIRVRGSRSGQAIVIMALAMVAMCGMLAIAIDAGRLYFQRRLMQDAVDAGALAGAQDLVGTSANPNGVPSNALFHALQDSLAVFGQVSAHPQGDAFYNSPPGNSVTETKGGYTVTAVAPSGYNNKQVQVSVTFSATASFAQIIGFTNIAIRADATAEAGTNAKTYALFAYAGPGGVSTIWNDQDSFALVDNGQEGADACNAGTAGPVWLNAKFNVPSAHSGMLNINGRATVNNGSDNFNLAQYWVQGVNFGSGVDPKPTFLGPDTSQLPAAPARTTIPTGAGQSVGNDNFTNTSGVTYYVYSPGKYTSAIAIPGAGDAANAVYIFRNGIYDLLSVNLTITGGTVGNTSNGLPKYSGKDGMTDLNGASDGTNGIEFVLDGTATFSATNTSSPNGGSVFFVGPKFMPTGSTGIAFYVPSTNSNTGKVWSETMSATASNGPRFQVWGTVFDGADASSAQLTGVQKGPHNLNPSSTDSSGQFAINGEFIASAMVLSNGQVLGNAGGTAAACPGGSITPGSPSLLVQYNPKFAPAPGVNSYLVK
jgi:Flp pilus assembly protein TadG